MNEFIFILEMIGTIAFAISGAVTGMKKNMDLFGITVLGVTTAVGGGMFRDLILGDTPPAMFRDPVYAVTAIITSLIVFIPSVRYDFLENTHVTDRVLFWMDTFGLGVFTVVGVEKAFSVDVGSGLFLTVFVGVITGVGGGLLRDIMAGNMPYIFVKHIYACACIAGSFVCALLWKAQGETFAMMTGMAVVIVIRFLAARYHWSLPRPYKTDMVPSDDRKQHF